MSNDDFNDIDEPSFFQKYRFVIVGVVVALIVGVVVASSYLFTGKIPPPRKPQEISISLPPPPPPPPPPPTPPPPKPPPPEQKMVEITPVKPIDKPKDMAKAPDKAPGPPGPKASGPPSDDGIGGGGGGDGTIGGGGGQDPLAVYAGEVQDAVKQALSRNSTTNHASIHKLKVRIWIDANGRVTRATPTGSSGDPAVDEALKSQALVGVQIPSPPPSGKSLSIYMFIDAARPN